MSKKLTNQEFLRRVQSIYGDEYEFMDEYVSMYVKIRCKHIECGKQILVTPHDFLRGHGCALCSDKKRLENNKNHNKNRFLERLLERSGGRIILMGNWTNSTEPTMFYDSECGTWYKAIPNSVDKSFHFACPRCIVRSKPKDDKVFQKEVRELYGEEYTFLEKYKNATTKIECQHNICGYVWKIQPNNFLTGYGCPRCSQSHGEKAIEKWLSQNNYDFIPQKIFPACRDKRPLPFDFFLPQYNLAIEYDGEQHYKPFRHFGGEEKYGIRRNHDLMKNKYCADNNINLLRIPYTVIGGNVGKVIQNKLDELKQLDNVA